MKNDLLQREGKLFQSSNLKIKINLFNFRENPDKHVQTFLGKYLLHLGVYEWLHAVWGRVKD